jgi:Fe2+ transport system protein FeoA
MRLAFSSDPCRALSTLTPGETGVVVAIEAGDEHRTNRLLALGVTPGAAITVLQTYPGVVFLCDQTELAVEHAVAAAIVVRES